MTADFSTPNLIGYSHGTSVAVFRKSGQLVGVFDRWLLGELADIFDQYDGDSDGEGSGPDADDETGEEEWHNVPPGVPIAPYIPPPVTSVRVEIREPVRVHAVRDIPDRSTGEFPPDTKEVTDFNGRSFTARTVL